MYVVALAFALVALVGMGVANWSLLKMHVTNHEGSNDDAYFGFGWQFKKISSVRQTYSSLEPHGQWNRSFMIGLTSFAVGSIGLAIVILTSKH